MDHYYNSIINNHNHTSLWNKCNNNLPIYEHTSSSIQEENEEEETHGKGEVQLRSTCSLPLIPQQPQTPKEPMEFLSRSWSVSAEEISKALASRHKHFLLENNNSSNSNSNSNSNSTSAASSTVDGGGGGNGSPLMRTVTSPAHMLSDHGMSLNPYPLYQPDYHHNRLIDKPTHKRIGSLTRWFTHGHHHHHHHHHKDSISSSPNNHHHVSSSVKKKDRARVENAHLHAVLTIAGLSAALAAIANSEIENSGGSKMGRAMASASELLASHCIEIAEQSGIENERIAGVVKSAVDIKSASDLMTLTAAAATALRGEAALRSRLPKETGRRMATISPCDKTILMPAVAAVDAQFGGCTAVEPLLSAEIVHEEPSCVGELMQHTRKGALKWKRVTVYINKKSQVMMKLKSNHHVAGAFSKKDKCLVYGVCDQISAWPARKTERENIDSYFGLKTAQGFLEFKCKNKVHKKQWVDGIRTLLTHIGDVDIVDKSMGQMTINHNPLHCNDL